MSKKFYGVREVVSVNDTTVTLKGGEQIEMTPQVITHCITNEKKTPTELLAIKHNVFQAYVLDASKILGLTQYEVLEGLELTKNTWARKKAEAIMIATFGKTPEEAKDMSNDPNWILKFRFDELEKFI